jgi:DNA-binding transcriptional MerR regulator
MMYVDIGRAMSTKTLTQAAKEIGVSSVTLRRWLRMKKVAEVKRDRNGWRVFSDDDITRIKVYATQTTPPETE